MSDEIIVEVLDDGRFALTKDDLNLLVAKASGFEEMQRVLEAKERENAELRWEIEADNRNAQGFLDQIYEMSKEKDELRAWQTKAVEDFRDLHTQLSATEAKLDAIMLEFCPDEMTDEQRERFKNAVSAKEDDND